MAVYCFTQLIQPGKREEALFDEIRGPVVASTRPLADGWASARRRCGSRGCPRREMAVVYWEGEAPAGRWKSSHALRIPSTSG